MLKTNPFGIAVEMLAGQPAKRKGQPDRITDPLPVCLGILTVQVGSVKRNHGKPTSPQGCHAGGHVIPLPAFTLLS